MRIVENVVQVGQLYVDDPDNLAYVVQTTLSVDDARRIIDALTARFPGITGPDIRTICYATQTGRTRLPC